MRLIVTTDKGIRYGGRLYRKGEELELGDKKTEKQWGVVFLAKKWARKHDPVVLGTAPRQAPPRAAPPAPEPTAEPSGWMHTPWAEAEPTPAAEPPQEEAPAEHNEESEEHIEEAPHGAPPRRGRHHRRDMRPEE